MKITNKALHTYSNIVKRVPEESFAPIKDLKVAITLTDGNVIEAAVYTVLKNEVMERHLCLSTQVGCKFGCKFCMSGANGFYRNLTVDEMIKEIMLLAKEENIDKFDDIMFMGIGEPLDNYDNVVSCMRLINDLTLSNKISLATVGLPDELHRLAETDLTMQLWVSLHAADDDKRRKIIPLGNKHTIASICDEAAHFAKRKDTVVLLNYMLFAGFNDSNNDLQNIANIVNNRCNFLGIMITEPNKDLENFRKASYKECFNFANNLRKCNTSLNVRVFVSKGRDVRAGCGEFAFSPARDKDLVF